MGLWLQFGCSYDVMMINDRISELPWQFGNWLCMVHDCVCPANDLAALLEEKRMPLVKGANNLFIVHFNKWLHIIGIRTLVQGLALDQFFQNFLHWYIYRYFLFSLQASAVEECSAKSSRERPVRTNNWQRCLWDIPG